MQAKECKRRILRLKEWRTLNSLSIEDVVRMFPDGFPSDTTIRRIFSKGGEDKSFRESTIAALELTLLGKVYAPEIKIPVMDVVKAQEDTAKRFADENKRLRRTVEQQAEIIRTLVFMALICIAFFSGVALYDFLSHSTGFWGTNSSGVWIIKVAFIVCVAAALAERIYALRKLRAKFESEEQAAAEVGL